jgi:hypothetical protein
VCFSLRWILYNWKAPRKPMPRAIGFGSNLIVLPLSAYLRGDLNDSFLWKFCLSHVARLEEKVREGTETRACGCEGAGNGVRAGARMSWRMQGEAMSIYNALTRPRFDISCIVRPKFPQISGERVTAMASRGKAELPPPTNDVLEPEA